MWNKKSITVSKTLFIILLHEVLVHLFLNFNFETLFLYPPIKKYQYHMKLYMYRMVSVPF